VRLLAFLAVLVAFWPVTAWDFMLVAGIVHRDWWPAVPSMGVAAAFTIAGFTTLFCVLIGLLAGLLRAMSGDAN
jgi:hypothetical protein